MTGNDWFIHEAVTTVAVIRWTARPEVLHTMLACAKGLFYMVKIGMPDDILLTSEKYARTQPVRCSRDWMSAVIGFRYRLFTSTIIRETCIRGERHVSVLFHSRGRCLALRASKSSGDKRAGPDSVYQLALSSTSPIIPRSCLACRMREQHATSHAHRVLTLVLAMNAVEMPSQCLEVELPNFC